MEGEFFFLLLRFLRIFRFSGFFFSFLWRGRAASAPLLSFFSFLFHQLSNRSFFFFVCVNRFLNWCFFKKQRERGTTENESERERPSVFFSKSEDIWLSTEQGELNNSLSLLSLYC